MGWVGGVGLGGLGGLDPGTSKVYSLGMVISGFRAWVLGFGVWGLGFGV